MSLPTQNLDEKLFEELVRDARALIPRYSDRWTDHNLHDPGMTFIDLFAWLTEIQRYRLNRVSSKSYHEFLKLAGSDLLPLRAARVYIGMDKPGAAIVLFSGTKIAPVGKESLVFELDRDYFLNDVTLVRVETRYDDRTIDQTRANEKSEVRFEPFGPQAPVGAELRFRLRWGDAIPQNPYSEFHLAFDVFQADLPAVGEHRGEPEEPVSSVQLRWEYRPASIEWRALPVIFDETNNLNRTGFIFFLRPDDMVGDVSVRCRIEAGHYEIPPVLESVDLNQVRAVQIETIRDEAIETGTGLPGQQVRLAKTPNYRSSSAWSVIYAGDVLDWSRFATEVRKVDAIRAALAAPTLTLLARIGAGEQLSSAERVRVVRDVTNALRVAYLFCDQTCRDRCKGDERSAAAAAKLSSMQAIVPEGTTPGKRAVLNRCVAERVFEGGINRDGLVLEIEDAGEWRVWDQRNGFDDSGPADRHYVLDENEGKILFGNGLNGQVPARNARICAAYYRHSEGAGGNVAPEHRWSTGQVTGALFGKNKHAGVGGVAAETVEAGQRRARTEFNNRDRAVTAQDFENLAKSTPGLRIARARVIPNFHPSFPTREMSDCATVVVVPHGRRSESSEDPFVPPVPGDAFLAAVRRHLDRHRLITTSVHVIGAKYIPVSIACTVSFTPGVEPKALAKNVRERLNRFLDPMAGGPDEGQGWPFGRDVFPSEIHQSIKSVAGVQAVTDLTINGLSNGKNLEIAPMAIPYAGKHTISLAPATSTRHPQS